MKKKKIQNLALRRNVISSFTQEKLTGGNDTRRTDCTICCWVDETYPCGTYMSC